MLAAQAHRDDRSKTTQNNAFSVNQDPAFFDIRWGSGKGFHISPEVWGGARPQSFGLGCYREVQLAVKRRKSKLHKQKQHITN
jgi:hypothetical protein